MNANTFASLLDVISNEDFGNLNIALKHIERSLHEAGVSEPMVDIFIAKMVQHNLEAFRSCKRLQLNS